FPSGPGADRTGRGQRSPAAAALAARGVEPCHAAAPGSSAGERPVGPCQLVYPAPEWTAPRPDTGAVGPRRHERGGAGGGYRAIPRPGRTFGTTGLAGARLGP